MCRPTRRSASLAWIAFGKFNPPATTEATREADPTKAYNQDSAPGFIRLNALRLKVAAKVQRK